MTYNPDAYVLRKRWPWRRYAAAGVAAGVVVLLVLNCSGMRLPFWNVRSALNEHLRAGLGITLPDSAKVAEGSWVAHRDAEHLFLVQMAPMDVRPWFAALLAAAPGHDYEVDRAPVRPPHPVFRAPGWWKPETMAGGSSLMVRPAAGKAGAGEYGFIYSANSGEVLVVWEKL